MSEPKKKAIEVLLPPAVGYSLQILATFLFKNKISLRYIPRFLVMSIINLINWPFRTYERLVINPRFKKLSLEKDPVFIIGHWRSGTTHLHNILTRDKQMGYLTTFQGVFPDTLFNILGTFIFKNFTQFLIPSTRKGDNVTLRVDNPQEEEFALGDKIPLSYYNFWIFPRNAEKYYDTALRWIEVKNKQKEKWKNNYSLLVKKALRNTGGKRFLSKNPPSTARIKAILEIFPTAKFIHIHRNPIEVYLSTTHFFNVMMPHLQLQSFSDEERETMVVKVYKRMMKDFLNDRKLIPEENLVDISFHALERKPIEVLRSVYHHLQIPGFDEAEPRFSTYIQSMKSYEKNRHTINKEKLDLIMDEWGFAMKQWGYDVPEHIDVMEG